MQSDWPGKQGRRDRSRRRIAEIPAECYGRLAPPWRCAIPNPEHIGGTPHHWNRATSSSLHLRHIESDFSKIVGGQFQVDGSRGRSAMSEYVSNHLGGNRRPQQTHGSCMTKSMRSVFPLPLHASLLQTPDDRGI